MSLIRMFSLIAGLAVMLFTGGFFYFASTLTTSRVGPPDKADGIVALTGGAFRISDALGLLAADKAQRLLITGVNPITTRTELVKLSPDKGRLFQCCIDIDRVARDTVGNAVETRNWARRLGFASLIVVTSSYHMQRSLMELKRVMPEITLIPYPVVPVSLRNGSWWAHEDAWRLLMREYTKLLASYIRLGADRLFTNPIDRTGSQ